MKTIETTYSETELGWVSEDITLTGDVRLDIKLQEKGIIIIKKRNDTGSANPKIHISSCTDEAEYLLKGESKGKIIQIVTSTEPEKIDCYNV